MKKLISKDVLEYIKNGAVLTKNYGIYSFWSLKTIDGKYITNIRQGTCEIVKRKNKDNMVIINQDKHGYSLIYKK
jgi:hypothetical protein